MKRFRKTAAFLAGWLGVVLLGSLVLHIQWFGTGDFSWREAMAYHAVLVPCWMLLLFGYVRWSRLRISWKRTVRVCSILGSILVAAGAAMIKKEGFSVGTLLLVPGLFCAELTALIILFTAFVARFRKQLSEVSALGWWTVTIGLVGMSLATTWGHYVGLAKDFSAFAVELAQRVKEMGLTPEKIDAFLGSHSHEMVASFLAAAFAIPFLRKEWYQARWTDKVAQLGLWILLATTLGEILLYQYCGWKVWEPPTLFAQGPRGIPLDDFLLILQTCGFLLLIPRWLSKWSTDGKEVFVDIRHLLLIIAVIAYAFIVVIKGIEIETHSFFYNTKIGQESVEKYVRGHLLFGFLLLPIVLATLANLPPIRLQPLGSLLLGIGLVALAFAVWGVLVHSESSTHIAFVLTAFFCFGASGTLLEFPKKTTKNSG